MMKVILVDDEPLARDRLRRMLGDQQHYQVVAEAASGAEAVSQAQRHRPDVVLLDIRMPGMDGMEAARHLTQLPQPPAVVFCTAYDEYAVSAFEVQAVGYVLKPVRKEQLIQALQRAAGVSRRQLDALRPEPQERTHLSAKNHAGVELIPLQDISHLLAEQKYVTAYYGNREVLLDESLKQLELEFSAAFLRIHRNCLVSLSHVEKLVLSGPGQGAIKLRGREALLNVSRRHLTQVKKVLKNL